MGPNLSHRELVDQLTLLSLRMEAIELEMADLKKDRIGLLSENKKLKHENANLRSINQTLTNRLADLEQKLLSPPLVKDSSNSSKPPSQDILKQTQSRRRSSGKKSGGQPGHKGHSLTFSSNPDKRNHLIPSYCNQCGAGLDQEAAELLSTRQVIELPVIRPQYIAYECYGIACSCGHFQKEAYPEGVNSPIQYSGRIAALVSYLSVYQYLPYRRLKQAMEDLFGIKLSEGSIANLLERMKEKSLPVYKRIRATLANAPVVGSDETGAYVGGKKQWIWTWQNQKNTFLSIDPSRGKKAVEAQFPQGFPNSILQADRWPAQLNTPAAGYQLCLAHLERNLLYLEALEKQKWTQEFQKLIKRARKLKKHQPQYDRDDSEAKKIEKQLDRLLAKSFCQEKAPKTYSMRNSIRKHRDKILTFLYHKEVLPDNNASERAIRNVRVKQKISGQFKSGHKAFCVLRSVIDTTIKRNLRVWDVLTRTADI